MFPRDALTLEAQQADTPPPLLITDPESRGGCYRIIDDFFRIVSFFLNDPSAYG